jgi:hypothetical protein
MVHCGDQPIVAAGDLDSRLVTLDLADLVEGLDSVSHLHIPSHQLHFSDAFSDVS